MSALFLWLSLRNANLEQIRDSLAMAEPAWIFPFLVALFIFYWLKSRRWRDLLAPSARIETIRLFPAVMIGYAGTAILPMQLGELIRVYVVSRRESLSYSLVLGSIAIERVFDFLSVLAVLGFVLLAGQDIPDALRLAGYIVALGCAAALSVTALLVTRTELVLRVTGVLAGWMPPRAREKVLEQLRFVAEGFQVLRHPRLLISVAVNSIVQWLLMGLCIWFSLWAVGISVPLAGAATVLIATIIGVSLPTSPGYIGNIQIAFTVGLMLYDVPAGSAVAASIYYHVLAYVSVLLTGFFFIHRYGYNFGQLRKDAADSAHP